MRSYTHDICVDEQFCVIVLKTGPCVHALQGHSEASYQHLKSWSLSQRRIVYIILFLQALPNSCRGWRTNAYHQQRLHLDHSRNSLKLHSVRSLNSDVLLHAPIPQRSRHNRKNSSKMQWTLASKYRQNAYVWRGLAGQSGLGTCQTSLT